MALITFAEAAIRTGWSIEFIEGLTKRCPKSGESRCLDITPVVDIPHLHESDVDAYRTYLNEPWPLPTSGNRPRIPTAIGDDVRAESHHQCAICGSMDNGELAHIDPAAKSLNNSPDNLLLLCPNHHTKYDLGHVPASNVDRETILAAKRMKRSSRRRMLQYEGNTAKALRVLLTTIKKVEGQVTAEFDDVRRQAYSTELQALLEVVPKLSHDAQDAAAKDQAFAEDEAAILENAPALVRLTEGIEASQTEAAARTTAQLVIGASQPIIDLDEVDCPHCQGRGTTGLVGDLCAYCRGSQTVSEGKAAEYEPDEIDEVDCPHCGGRGTTGLSGDLCSYCRGSQRVSEANAVEYEPDEIDEVDCLHCGGRGTTGLEGDYCAFCHGSQQVTEAKAAEYDPAEIDEVECPHCGGRGTTGLAGDYCSFWGLRSFEWIA